MDVTRGRGGDCEDVVVEQEECCPVEEVHSRDFESFKVQRCREDGSKFGNRTRTKWRTSPLAIERLGDLSWKFLIPVLELGMEFPPLFQKLYSLWMGTFRLGHFVDSFRLLN